MCVCVHTVRFGSADNVHVHSVQHRHHSSPQETTHIDAMNMQNGKQNGLFFFFFSAQYVSYGPYAVYRKSTGTGVFMWGNCTALRGETMLIKEKPFCTLSPLHVIQRTTQEAPVILAPERLSQNVPILTLLCVSACHHTTHAHITDCHDQAIQETNEETVKKQAGSRDPAIFLNLGSMRSMTALLPGHCA